MRSALTEAPRPASIESTQLSEVLNSEPEDVTLAEIESVEHQESLDAATAAQTVAELDVEIETLGRLVGLATRVVSRGRTRKWQQLRSDPRFRRGIPPRRLTA